MCRVLTLFVSVALLAATCAAASDTYAGLTRTQAVAKAETAVVSLGVALDGWTPAQAVTWRHRLHAIDPKTARATCKHRPAWRVLWPKSTPIYVNRHGIVLACR